MIPNGVTIPLDSGRIDSNVRFRLLYLGRLHPIKGVESLLAACALLKSSSSDWVLSIAGSGDPSYLEFLSSKVEEWGLSGNVEFLGEILEERKGRLLAECDVVVVPSHVENFAIVVAESLAHAVPVIASKSTPWEGLETHQCGLWVENDPVNLAAAIRTIRTLPLKDMGERGREWMKQCCSWESVSKQMLAVYGESVRTAARYV
ncbi:MAG: glycosyltransferase [Acidobacteriota bacterium]|nr:glycosyltransferase [Acidobacteriota bacterium]